MLSHDFILGMIAGEGSFHVLMEQPSGGTIDRQRPVFTMTMHEDDILRQMALQLGLGVVTDDAGERFTWRINNKQQVNQMRNWVLENISEDFKATDKFRQFKLWSEAVDIIPDDRTPLSKLQRKRLVEISYEIPKSDTKNLSKDEWFEIIENTDIHYCGAETQSGEECGNRVPTESAKCRHH